MVDVLNAATGEIVAVWSNAGNEIDVLHTIEWDGRYNIAGKTAYVPDGRYRFRIRVWDKHNNESRFYADVIKGDIPPQIIQISK